MCLDVLRALEREPATREALSTLLHGSIGKDARYDRFVTGLMQQLDDPLDGEARARVTTANIALAVQAAELLTADNTAVAEAFLASRIASTPPAAFGTLPRGIDHSLLIERMLS